MSNWEKNPDICPTQEHVLLTIYPSTGPQWQYIAEVLNSIRRSVTPPFVQKVFEKLVESGDARALHAHRQASATGAHQAKTGRASEAFARKRRRSSHSELYLSGLLDDEAAGPSSGSRARRSAPAASTPQPVYTLALPTLPVYSAGGSGSSSGTAAASIVAAEGTLAVTSDGRNPLGESTCRICLTNAREEDILLCDGCGADHHKLCLHPPLGTVPPDVWFCPGCDVVKGLLGPMALQGLPLHSTQGDPGSSFNRMQRALKRMG